MVNWAQLYDWHSDVDRVPELLSRVEREVDGEAWAELGRRLILEGDLVSPAGIAALPRLVRLATGCTEARLLAGEIMERAAGHHGVDDVLAPGVDAIAEFGVLLDRHLESRPTDYVVTLRAARGPGAVPLGQRPGGLHGRLLRPVVPSLRYTGDDCNRRLRALLGDPRLEPGRRGSA
ncbi:hypothetical protein GCM10017674_81450 [Streptomyces gardneri]|uniref:Uncharacterized protein n=1 Tax=Streptomyces gardneri TaxID=66892 RepID=A0A4Y3RXQ7_9ACTN|nr:hypothetical protein SGA01_79470 [Streptomyces gardneri]GHH24223.1 hypothetical protein GCM10017674_81450 [Streptomyces gardneri]